jgi:hypothetical protein
VGERESYTHHLLFERAEALRPMLVVIVVREEALRGEREQPACALVPDEEDGARGRNRGSTRKPRPAIASRSLALAAL